jgi:hypothetical protein
MLLTVLEGGEETFKKVLKNALNVIQRKHLGEKQPGYWE